MSKLARPPPSPLPKLASPSRRSPAKFARVKVTVSPRSSTVAGFACSKNIYDVLAFADETLEAPSSPGLDSHPLPSSPSPPPSSPPPPQDSLLIRVVKVVASTIAGAACAVFRVFRKLF